MNHATESLVNLWEIDIFHISRFKLIRDLVSIKKKKN